MKCDSELIGHRIMLIAHGLDYVEMDPTSSKIEWDLNKKQFFSIALTLFRLHGKILWELSWWRRTECFEKKEFHFAHISSLISIGLSLHRCRHCQCHSWIHQNKQFSHEGRTYRLINKISNPCMMKTMERRMGRTEWLSERAINFIYVT